MFFVTLRTTGGGHFDPPANLETKEATSMKFLNSHCSIVCGYCSVFCLTVKSIVKNDQIFKFFQIKRNS